MAASALFMLSMTAANVCGDLDAAMTEQEATAARPPLARILQRMGGDTVALMEKWADPILLLQAFAVYGQRAYGVYRRNHPSEQPGSPTGGQATRPAPPAPAPAQSPPVGDPASSNGLYPREATYHGLGSF